jgi:hypothetical protein
MVVWGIMFLIIFVPWIITWKIKNGNECTKFICNIFLEVNIKWMMITVVYNAFCLNRIVSVLWYEEGGRYFLRGLKFSRPWPWDFPPFYVTCIVSTGAAMGIRDCSVFPMSISSRRLLRHCLYLGSKIESQTAEWEQVRKIHMWVFASLVFF